MRKAFVDTLTELAARDERILLLTGDLGFSVLEPFAERFPDRFFNCGVAEQNMLGVATGLAESGLIPYVYSIATFASMRPYEFIRNGAILHQLPVRIVGVGGGFDYGHNGATHYAVEDIGIMRMQPGITVVVPGDDEQARSAVAQTYDAPGPVYYRMAKAGPAVPGLSGPFELGGLVQLRTGEDVVLIAIGTIVVEALAAADQLAAAGIDVGVVLVQSFNPSPEEALAELLANAGLAVSVESHLAVGGLGSFVAEVIAGAGLGTRLRRHAIADLPRGVTGSQTYLENLHGLSAAALTEAVLAEVGIRE